MSGGDIKFIAPVGALLGWQQVILIIFLSAFVESLAGLVGLVEKNQCYEPNPFRTLLGRGNTCSVFFREAHYPPVCYKGGRRLLNFTVRNGEMTLELIPIPQHRRRSTEIHVVEDGKDTDPHAVNDGNF